MHTIGTGGAKPIKQQPRRPPRVFAADERNIIEEQLKAGVIKEPTSPWASPCVYMSKNVMGVQGSVSTTEGLNRSPARMLTLYQG